MLFRLPVPVRRHLWWLGLLCVPLARAQNVAPGNPGPSAVRLREQEAAGGEWTLERAVARAIEANTELLAAKHEVERQEGTRLQVQARMLPSIAGSAGINERERGLVDVPPKTTGEFAPPDERTGVALFGYDMQVEIRQLVFDGFASWNATQRQRLLSKQAFLNLAGVVTRTVSLVRQGFDAILLSNAAVAAERRRVDEYEQLVKITERKQSAGDIPEFELLRAQAEFEGARADLAEAVRAQGQAEQSFRRLLQLSPLGELRLVGRFESRAFAMSLDEAVGRARANRPDLEAAAVAVEAARRSQLAELGNYLPKIEAFASYGMRTSYYNSSNRLDGWTYGLGGRWDIFDGGAARGRRMTLRADRRAAEEKLADLQHGIVSKLHELYQGLEQAKSAMEAQGKSMSLSARASRDARRQYEVGSASLEQVLQAEITRRQAESRLNQAIYNYNSLVAEIELSVGGQVEDSLKVPESSWKP